MRRLFFLMILAAQASTVIAQPATMDKQSVKLFIQAGGFHALCDRLQWQWGYINGISPACFSDHYAKRNGWHYNPADHSWTK